MVSAVCVVPEIYRISLNESGVTVFSLDKLKEKKLKPDSSLFYKSQGPHRLLCLS